MSVARLETLAGVNKCLLIQELAGLHRGGIPRTTRTAGCPKSKIVLAIFVRGHVECYLKILREK